MTTIQQNSHQSKWVTFDYSVAKNGGAIGAHVLPGFKLPDNAILLRAYIEPAVAPVSAGAATISVGFNDTNVSETQMLSAVAKTDNALDPTQQQYKGYNYATGPLKISKAGGASAVVTIGTAALTAGTFRLHVEVRAGN